MKVLFRIIPTGCVLFFILFFSACRSLPEANLPQAMKVPGSFSTNADSSGLDTLEWKTFFTDPYLVALIDTSLKNNLDLKVALQRIRIAQANLQLSKGAMLPSVSVDASAGVTKYGDHTIDGVGNYDTNLSPNLTPDQHIPDPVPDYFLGLRSSWEVDIWGKLKHRKKAAFARLLASQKGKQLVETMVASQVASMYYELLALDTELRAIERNIILQEQAVEMIGIQKQGGQVTELAVQQFKAQLLNTRSREMDIRRNIAAVENQLNYLSGRFSGPILRANDLLSQKLPEQIQTGIPSQMLLRRPDIQQAELELAASKVDVTAARRAFLPSLTLSPYIGYNAFRASELFNSPGSLAYGLLGGISAPLLNQRQLKGNYNIQIARNEEEFYTYQNKILSAFQEVSTSLQSVNNLQRKLDLNIQEVDVLRNAASISQDLFLVGYANYLEIITAQKSVLDAELALAETKKDLFISVIDLYRSLGGGWGR